MKNMKFRTPVKCQNDHKAFWYWKIPPMSFGVIETVHMPPEKCGCSTIDFGEGWSRDGDDQMFIGIQDALGIDIYEGSIMDSNPDKYPEDLSPYVIIFEDGSFRTLRSEWPENLKKPIVDKSSIECLEDRIIGSTHLTPELIP